MIKNNKDRFIFVILDILIEMFLILTLSSFVIVGSNSLNDTWFIIGITFFSLVIILIFGLIMRDIFYDEIIVKIQEIPSRKNHSQFALPFDDLISDIIWKDNKQGFLVLNSIGQIEGASDYLLSQNFDYFIGKDLTYFNKLDERKKITLNFDDKIWRLVYYEELNIIFVREKTKEFILEEISKTKYIFIKIKFNVSESTNIDNFEYSSALNNASKIFADFVSNEEGFYIEILSRNIGIGIIESNNEKTIIELFTSFFQNATSQFKEGDVLVNFSVGIGVSNNNLKKSNTIANEALKLSTIKGINQLVIKKQNGEIQYPFESVISERTKTELSNLNKFINNLEEKIIESDKVIITGHKNADLDCFGAAIGISKFVKNVDTKEIKVIMNSYDSTTKSIAQKEDNFTSEYQNLFSSYNPSEITSKTILIIVDTSSSSLVQQASNLNSFDSENIFIIDHHPEGAERIDAFEKNKLIDTSASSASELVASILKIQEPKIEDFEINSKVSTILLSGIYLDTNSLLKNTNEKTFEIISWLIKHSASIKDVTSFLKSEKFDLNIYSEVIKNIQRIDNIIISNTDDSIILQPDLISIFADELLKFQDVDATFLISKISSTKYKLSCRSNGKINVQEIANKLGGGGKKNSAAVEFDATLEENNISEIRNKIINLFSK